jgi:hypothetical protein
MKEAPKAFVFMKVGNHAGETFEQIMERKNEEYRRTGRILWGYGGSACHPTRQVQPFAKEIVEAGGTVYVLMQEIDSRANPALLPATQYSEDGINWVDMPEGNRVTGSRYALVLDEIKPADFEIDTRNYVVGAGPSLGANAAEYMRGHIDKACLLAPDKPVASTSAPKVKRIKLAARLIKPYAVLVRNKK